MKYLSISVILIFSLSTYANPKTEVLLIYGDSISAGYGMSKEKQWSVILQEKINENDVLLPNGKHEIICKDCVSN